MTYIKSNFKKLSISMEFGNIYQYHSPPKVSCKNTTYNPTL